MHSVGRYFPRESFWKKNCLIDESLNLYLVIPLLVFPAFFQARSLRSTVIGPSTSRTKKGSNEPVEFAIKLPGRSEDESAFVYLPIDAKFPKDTYEHLLAAYESAIPEDIESATKNLETVIKKMAKDIRDKYLDPPNTTDFAIMFLPFESIYAEVMRRSSLIDQLRTEFQITVAGPTTLMAILNSLQMGFRTLAWQKRSSEVWKVLGSVKKEFENFKDHKSVKPWSIDLFNKENWFCLMSLPARNNPLARILQP